MWTAALALVLACSLRARDWSAVPATDFAARAEAAIAAEVRPERTASLAADILNAAMARKDLGAGQLASVVTRVYASAAATPPAVARDVYVRIEAPLRPRVAAILVRAAPAAERQRVTELIRVVNRPPPPGIESTMREIRLRAIGKD